ncbi:MAG: heparan N-sulfatase, partial [Gimesia sp.]
DNGMPFPRVKGQEYERSNHLPLAIMWKQGIKTGNRVIDDYISFIDFAPTFVEAAGLTWEETGMQPATGQSLSDIFNSEKSGIVNPKRDHVLIGKERHDIGRPFDQGYPIRGIVKGGMLYLKNDEPSRWPAGNPETGYLNCDASPTKTAILQFRREGTREQFWNGAFGKRQAEELYSIQDDPECMKNLATQAEFQAIKQSLKQQMHAELKAQKDPRELGNGSVFESYQYSDARTRNFYQRFMQGEKIKAGWVNETDFESKPLD